MDGFSPLKYKLTIKVDPPVPVHVHLLDHVLNLVLTQVLTQAVEDGPEVRGGNEAARVLVEYLSRVEKIHSKK